MSKLYGDFLGGRAAWGLLLLRLVTGVALMMHGWGKFLHPFDWMNKPGRPSTIPGWMQALAALGEFGGGLGLVLGVVMPLACLGVMFTMLGAKFIGHASDPWINPGGKSWELASLYLLIATALLLIGPGRFSIDSLLFDSVNRVPDERLNRFRRDKV